MSGLTSSSPLFSANRLAETLCGGYFEILGTLSSDPKGLAMMERWRIFNMFYHIVELKDRDDLLQAILGNMDYTL
jgi:rapamycin-insensitive companion of mTOR